MPYAARPREAAERGLLGARFGVTGGRLALAALILDDLAILYALIGWLRAG